ncbi:hypothetical protein D7294_00750 [Streptomyces hoynatensis]|uniref:Uncharacterized protein n=1 Tax=Streptomyces hoynatensis TaxID=1141874 RepID=A0A3A9ZF25_9ACTN|nr:hypothetical protein D7294_00750 [Streptomyces hoynatensis]
MDSPVFGTRYLMPSQTMFFRVLRGSSGFFRVLQIKGTGGAAKTREKRLPRPHPDEIGSEGRRDAPGPALPYFE